MLELIAFCILSLFCSLSASGTAKLIAIVIEDGELFGAWQRVLARIDPKRGDRNYFLRELLYKRLGGCIICMRQFIAELSFIVLCVIFAQYAEFPTAGIDNIIFRWIVNAAIFIGYCGTVLQIGQWLEYEKRQADNEPIIETRYKNN